MRSCKPTFFDVTTRLLTRWLSVAVASLCLGPAALGGTLRVPAEYPTIRDAVDAAAECDTVLLAPGTYTGGDNRGIVDSTICITIMSEAGAESTVINLEGGFFMSLLDAPNWHDPYDYPDVELRGLTLANGGEAIATGEYNWSGLKITNCRFIGNVTGVGLDYPGDVTIDSCEFEQNQTGVHAEVSEFALLQRSLYIHNEVAMRFRIALNFEVKGNVLAFNDYAVYEEDWSALTFMYNIVYANEVGIHGLEVYGTTSGSCNNVFANDINYLATPDVTGQDGNVSLHPLFCDPTLVGGTGVEISSALLPENNDYGARIGNVEAACTCCRDRIGDANGSGNDEPTIGDISVMVDALFINQNWEVVPCLAEADVNQSGGLSPTEQDITIGDIVYLIDYGFICVAGCELPECPVVPAE